MKTENAIRSKEGAAECRSSRWPNESVKPRVVSNVLATVKSPAYTRAFFISMESTNGFRFRCPCNRHAKFA